VEHTASSTPRRRLRWASLAAAGAALTIVVAGVASAAFAAPLFADDFSDGNANGWTRSGGSWAVVTDGSSAYRQSGTSSNARALVGQSSWTNYAVQARVKPLAFNGSDRFVAVVARAQNSTNYYYLALRSTGRVELGKLVGGSSTTLASAQILVSTGTWYTVRLEVSGSSLRGLVSGAEVTSAADATFSAGRVGLATYNASASFDDVAVDTVPGGGQSSPPPSGPGPSPSGPGSPPPSPEDCTSPPRITGFASVNALGQNGTTGGCGGPTVTVDNATDFLSAIARPGPLVIRVSGMITLPGPMHDVTSHKTIVGVGSTSGITGAGLNIGVPLDNSVRTAPANAVRNVIIQNMVFTNAKDDSINVQMFSHHIWIDHNDLSNGYDGLIDIKRGSSYVTVSWNHTHHHAKNMLLGHDDSNGAQDVGNLKVTYHHNWFDQTPQRNPRVRFGEPVHIFNNYYLRNSDVGVACQANSGCVVEGNVFENTEEAYAVDYAGPRGRMIARNNIFIGESAGGTTDGTVQEPRTYYAYVVDDPNTVKAAVMAGAGTR